MIYLVFILLSTLTVYTNKDSVKAEVYSFEVEDLARMKYKIFDLLPTENNAIIFYHEYNCFECFNKLKSKYKEISDNTPNFNYIVIVRCSKDIITRKTILKKLNKYFDKSIIYFDSHSNEDVWPPKTFEEGIFSKFEIKYTPAVLEKFNGEINFKPFETLFPKKE